MKIKIQFRILRIGEYRVKDNREENAYWGFLPERNPERDQSWENREESPQTWEWRERQLEAYRLVCLGYEEREFQALHDGFAVPLSDVR